MFLVRFGVSDRFIYDKERRTWSDAELEHAGRTDQDGRRRLPEGAQSPNLALGTSFRHYYDLHGIVTIGSDVVLPELAHFHRPRASVDSTGPDIAIQVGQGRSGRDSGPGMVRSADGKTIRWEEQLGRASANFAIHFGSQILVTSSRALARSPHVLYTNVVEALLRFVFVDRGYMLLHAACMDVDGRGVMLSARTDTGKTGTVLKLLRTSGGASCPTT